VNGTRTRISAGIQGTGLAPLVSTDPEAQPRHKGMSMFIARKGSRPRASRKPEKARERGIGCDGPTFGDYGTPAVDLPGGEAGHGMQAASGTLSLAASASLRAATGWPLRC
jgi:alkylation response protein AidB-like acyl-CoA dehydrogenase